MQINIIQGTGFAAEDAKYNGAVTSALNYVTNFFDTMFTNNVTINIQINFNPTIGVGATNGSNLPLVQTTYANVRNALIAEGTGSLQQSAYSTLPTSDPTGGATCFLRPAYAAALGLSNVVDSTYVTFNSAWQWSFSTGAADSSGASFIGIAEHEITEIMGRVSSINATGNGNYGPIDLFRYSAPGTRELAANNGSGNDPTPTTGYFSIDNGATNLGGGLFNNVAGQGDTADYSTNFVPNDSFGPSSSPPHPFSLQDLYMMNVLGWNIVTPPNVIPNGVTDWVGPINAGNGIGTAQTSNGMIVGSGGFMQVASGGTASGTVLFSAGTVQIDVGGTASSTVVGVFGGGTDNVSGTDVGATVYGVQNVYGTASATVVDSGGDQFVLSGGTANITTVNSGALQFVYSGGTANNTTVNAGGQEFLGGILGAPGGTVSNAIINGGDQEIYSGGTAVGTTVNTGTVDVSSGGFASAATINSGGNEIVSSGGEQISATLTGNSANDTFVVYNSSDVVVPKAGSHDLVYSAVNYTLPTGVDRLILEGTATQGTGNSDAAGDALYAANASQAATLTGRSHNDTFVVYNSADTVIGQANSTDTVYAAASYILPTNVDTLLLEGAASQGTGNGDAVNVLYGNAGVASTLVAGSGNDILAVIGTAGTVLTGGAGHDTFAFPNAMGHDEVTNFNTGKDMLQFNSTLFSNFTAAMADASQVGANTVFAIDANDTVTLDNVAKSSLAAGNFHSN